MYKVIKENSLNIDVNTLLFGQCVRSGKLSNNNCWDMLHYYSYVKDDEVLTVSLSEFDLIKDSVVTCIITSDRKILVKGDQYWKVLVNEKEAKYHKLENNGKTHAKIFKPYRDIVHSNTNYEIPYYQQRFSTQSAALEYILKIKNTYESTN